MGLSVVAVKFQVAYLATCCSASSPKRHEACFGPSQAMQVRVLQQKLDQVRDAGLISESLQTRWPVSLVRDW